MASRLSENPFDNVLLLEAGGDENEISDVPTLAHYLQLSDMDWMYKTEPQANACLGFTGRVSRILFLLNLKLYVITKYKNVFFL